MDTRPPVPRLAPPLPARGLGALPAQALAAVLLAGCSPPCGDCFELSVRGTAEAWEPCCSYLRENIEDPAFVRFERLGGDRYTAGVQFGCRWSEDTVTIQPLRVLIDGAGVAVDQGVELQFTPDAPQIEVAVECDAFRPAPQYPEVVLDLRDPDLTAQFDPDAPEGEARIVIDWHP